MFHQFLTIEFAEKRAAFIERVLSNCIDDEKYETCAVLRDELIELQQFIVEEKKRIQTSHNYNLKH